MLGQSRRIVVLGGGFAGVYAACALERKFWRHPEVEIMLVSDENVLLFTPMLPEVPSSFGAGFHRYSVCRIEP